MAKAIHMMIRVLDEARSVAFYEKAFGLGIADRYVFESFTLVYLSNAETPFEVELTINHGRTEPYDLGAGYGHIAFAVDALEAEHARMTAAGINDQSDQGIPSRGRADGAFLLRRGPRRLQDRGFAAPRPIPLRRRKKVGNDK